MALLSQRERTRYAAFTRPEAAHSFALGRALIRELVAYVSAVPADAVRVDAMCPTCGGPHGKPIIAAPIAARGRIHVSVSRCVGVVVAAATTAGPIGVDVEPADTGKDRISGVRSIAPAPPGIDAESAEATLRRWTAIEAVLKADGRGLTLDPSNVTFYRTASAADPAIAADATGGAVTAQIGDERARYAVTHPQIDWAFVVGIAVAQRGGGSAGSAWSTSHRSKKSSSGASE